LNNEELVYSYQQGNRKALEELIENNKGIAHKLANNYYTSKTSSIDKEDLIQEAFLGLIKAAERYDFNNDKKARFITYAVYWMEHMINRFIKNRNTNEEISLNKPIGDSEKSELIDVIESTYSEMESIENKLYRKQLREELEQAMQKNTALIEREVLKFRYGWNNNQCITVGEVAELLTISEQETRNIETRAKRKLRDSTWGRIARQEYCRERRILSEYKWDAGEVALSNLNYQVLK